MAKRLTSVIHSICLLCVCAAGTQLAAACSGGSSGAGYGVSPTSPTTPTTPQTDPTYASSSTAFPDALPTDAASGNRVLVVLQQHRTPIGIWDEGLASQSKAMPFVLYEDSDAEQFASRWGIDSVPAVALCDQAGNLIALTSEPITAKNVHQLIDHAADEESDLVSELHAAYQRAERASASNHISAALAGCDAILHYKAFPICAQAATLQKSLLDKGHAAVTGAVASGDPSHSRSTLSELIRVYQGTVVADEARQALHQLE